MQFSKIRLLGFKSFVDPVELEILSGLTGIVGPNGCGKSNLLEALRWVMGENRPSSVRGGAMDDVIFAGTGTRVPKNFAEVLIKLNNVDKTLSGLDIPSGSVEILRRVTRDVGSSYRINGKDCRAKDISMLFADSSTGAHSPSLVRQGQIAELINASPKSRRRLLEEAAGISGLYQRRHEAELKLRSTENNLARLQDVIDQLENQIKALEKQAKQASKYENLAVEIRSNEDFLLCKKWVESKSKVLLEEDALMHKTKLLVSTEQEFIESSKNREKIEEKLPSLRNEETKFGATLQRLIIERDGIEKEQKRAMSIISELETRSEETKNDYVRQKNLIGDANEVIERVKWELSQLNKLSENKDELINKTQKDALDATKSLHDNELMLDSKSEDFAVMSASFENAEKQMGKAKDDLVKVIKDLNDSHKQTVSCTSELKVKEAELIEKKKYLNDCKEETKLAELSLESFEKLRVEALEVELQKRVDYSTLEGKLAALQSEQNLLNSSPVAKAGKSNQILDEVRIAKGYEMALGAAFSDDIKAPVIFSNNKSGWFELPDFKESNEFPNGVKSISSMVTAPGALKRSLSNIGLVANIDGPRLQKLLKPGQKLVSEDGSLWRWDGYCSIGGDNISEVALRLEQESRLKDLIHEILKTEKELESQKIDLKLAQATCLESEKAGALARVDRNKSEEKELEASRMVSSLESSINMLNSNLQNLCENSLLIESDKETLQIEVFELKNIMESQEDLGTMKHLLEVQRSVVEQSRELMAEKRAIFEQVKRDSDLRKKRVDELNLDLKNWKQRLILATESTIELEKRRVTVEKELKEAKTRPESLSKRRQSLVEMVRTLEKEKEENSDNLSKKESLLRGSLNKERELSRKVSGIREDVARMTATKENAESNLNDLRKLINEKTLDEPENLIASLPMSLEQLPEAFEIEKKLLLLKNSRDALGAVNLRAAEDSRELVEEWENLSTEKMDLETAVKKLRTAIIALNSEGRSRLQKAFHQVNKNFGQFFENLFSGGNAKLTFIESDDPLDAGLEIICQPPGKKLTTLSLLSGGEQTLTALALIFAVFKANPSPICVLDEVDAPLDDANVERFCSLLDEMTRLTQTRFMIITHHPLTMSRMDQLYGVTMVERGVSQLVSVDLKKAEQMVDL